MVTADWRAEDRVIVKENSVSSAAVFEATDSVTVGFCCAWARGESWTSRTASATQGGGHQKERGEAEGGGPHHAGPPARFRG